MSNEKTKPVHGGASASPAHSTDDTVTQVMSSKSKTTVGQLEIVEGPGAGTKLPIYTGTNALGRDPAKNLLAVDFGDEMISRNQHALITHDATARVFGIQGNGHANPVMLNGSTVTSLVRLMPGDRIKIGKTTFTLIA